MSSWSEVDAAAKRTFRRLGEPLTIALANGSLCTYGRITSAHVDIDADEGIILQGSLVIQLAWSDAKRIAEGDLVTRDDEETTHEVTVVRKVNDAVGRVGLQAAA